MCEEEPHWKSLEKKTSVVDEEFDNFLMKVDEVKNLVEGLASKDKTVAKNTMKIVEDYLGDKNIENDIDEDSLKIKTCRTSINQKAFDEMVSTSNPQQETQTPEAFMKSCEEDAKRRGEERRLQKESSDTFKKMAVIAFKKEDYIKALSLYNKAICEFRGSPHLYTSRALTCLRLKLYDRVLEDCGTVLRCFDERSFKALLFKAKAHRALGQEKEADKCVEDARNYHPKREKDIREYMGKTDDGEN